MTEPKPCINKIKKSGLRDHDSVNPYHAEFLKWNKPSYIFGTDHYLRGYIKMKTWRWSANTVLVAKANQFRRWQEKGWNLLLHCICLKPFFIKIILRKDCGKIKHNANVFFSKQIKTFFFNIFIFVFWCDIVC